MDNLLASTEVGTIFLDGQLRICGATDAILPNQCSQLAAAHETALDEMRRQGLCVRDHLAGNLGEFAVAGEPTAVFLGEAPPPMFVVGRVDAGRAFIHESRLVDGGVEGGDGETQGPAARRLSAARSGVGRAPIQGLGHPGECLPVERRARAERHRAAERVGRAAPVPLVQRAHRAERRVALAERGVERDLRTGQVSRLTANLDYDESVDMSPNGEWLAVGSSRTKDYLTKSGLSFDSLPAVVGWNVIESVCEAPTSIVMLARGVAANEPPGWVAAVICIGASPVLVIVAVMKLSTPTTV